MARKQRKPLINLSCLERTGYITLFSHTQLIAFRTYKLHKERARTADNFLKTAPLDWRRLTQANSRYPN